MLTICLVANFAQAEGKLQIINIAPDSNFTAVEVKLGDSILVDSLAFNNATAYLDVPANNDATISFISLSDTSKSFELSDVAIADDAYHQTILTGLLSDSNYMENPDGTSLEMMATWKAVDMDEIADGEMRIDFFHGVSDLIQLDVADLSLDYIVDDLGYKNYSNSTDIQKTKRDLFITSADRANTIASRSIDLAAINGKTLTVFFSGFLVPSSNQDGETINYFSVDEAGNVNALAALTTPVIEDVFIDFKYGPNPAQHFTNISFKNQTAKEVTFSIIDLSGRTHAEHHFNLSEGAQQITLQLPSVAKGLYFLQARSGDRQTAFPIVIAQ